MTATQSLRIYELLNAQFQQPERARQLTEAIEAVIDQKVEDSSKKYEVLNRKDLELIRVEVKEQGSRLETKIAESQTASLRWLIGLFITLALMIIGLYIKR